MRDNPPPIESHDDDDDREVDPLEGLMDPDDGNNSPAADADAPPPPG